MIKAGPSIWAKFSGDSTGMWATHHEIAKEWKAYSDNPIKSILEHNNQVDLALNAVINYEKNFVAEHGTVLEIMNIVSEWMEFSGYNIDTYQAYFNKISTCLEAQPDGIIDDLNVICGDSGTYHIDYI